MKTNKKTEQLFMMHARQMYNTCLRIVGNKHDAEDVLQEAYIKAYVNIKKLKNEASFGAWLRQIVVHQSIAFHRTKIHFVDIDLAENIDDAEDDSFLPTVNFKELNEQIKRLPDGARMVFSLYLLENYSHKEIAEMLNISESTSKSQFHRAKKILKEQLERRMING